MLKTSDFDYNLPKELIAQSPLEKRENCKMMHLNRSKQSIQSEYFFDIINYLNKDDILVLNDTKVYPARIISKRKTGAKVEIFLLNQTENKNCFEALLKNAKRVKIDEIIDVKDDFKIKIKEKLKANHENEIPKYIVELIFQGNNVYDILEKYALTPLPPYISRQADESDKLNYQTVFAKNIGSVACPTAGLHFSKELLDKIQKKGVKIAYITLNVGLGTFMPVKTDNIENHTMHWESFSIPKETEEIFQNKKGSIIAVGTTVLRCLEAVFEKHGKIIATKDATNIFIYPPYKIKSIDKLITNFHLPKSTLIMLVSAFAGKDFVFRAYKKAIDEKYRFFSYGDCMFIDC